MSSLLENTASNKTKNIYLQDRRRKYRQPAIILRSGFVV